MILIDKIRIKEKIKKLNELEKKPMKQALGFSVDGVLGVHGAALIWALGFGRMTIQWLRYKGVPWRRKQVERMENQEFKMIGQPWAPVCHVRPIKNKEGI